jgi:hypothetical protein
MIYEGAMDSDILLQASAATSVVTLELPPSCTPEDLEILKERAEELAPPQDLTNYVSFCTACFGGSNSNNITVSNMRGLLDTAEKFGFARLASEVRAGVMRAISDRHVRALDCIVRFDYAPWVCEAVARTLDCTTTTTRESSASPPTMVEMFEIVRTNPVTLIVRNDFNPCYVINLGLFLGDPELRSSLKTTMAGHDYMEGLREEMDRLGVTEEVYARGKADLFWPCETWMWDDDKSLGLFGGFDMSHWGRFDVEDDRELYYHLKDLLHDCALVACSAKRGTPVFQSGVGGEVSLQMVESMKSGFDCSMGQGWVAS